MYICRECKAEYKEKVEYCDCGNNTFDCVPDNVEAVKTPTPSAKKSLTLEEKSELVSRVFFALCIILSAIVWSIPVGKASKKPANSQAPAKVQSVETKSIPSIDKIWNDTPLYQPKAQQPRQKQSQLDKIREEIPLTSAPINDNRVASNSVQKKKLMSL